MLNKKKISSEFIEKYETYNPSLSPSIQHIADCLDELSDIMPNLELDAVVLNFRELIPNIALDKTASLEDLIQRGKPDKVSTYFQSLHSVLSKPEVKTVLEESILIDPNYTSTLFQFAASLHELYISGLNIKSNRDDKNQGLKPSYVTDLLKITYYLKNDKRLEHHLHTIDTELAKASQSNPSKTRSSFFFKWAKDNHFNQEEYATLNGFIDNAEHFFNLLDKKIPFKDKGAGGDHGAWAHLIQFFIITEENKLSKFLEHEPADIYAYLAKAECRGTSKYMTWNWSRNDKTAIENPLNAWDVFFDRFDRRDARTPSFISSKILSMDNIPTLQAKTKKQMLKYESQAHFVDSGKHEQIETKRHINKT